MPEPRPLRVFLCHAKEDKPKVRELYRRLHADGVEVWLDEKNLLPGQDWRVEIPRAVREADVVIVCMSSVSARKEGFVQAEINFALDKALEKPEGTIYIIPAKLEECDVPEKLSRWQCVNLFEDYEGGYEMLMLSLKLRAQRAGAFHHFEEAVVQADDRFDVQHGGERGFERADAPAAFGEFQVVLHRSPPEFGIQRVRWRLQDVGRALAWLEGCSEPGIYKVLKRLGFSRKQGLGFIHSPDPEDHAKWKRILQAYEEAMYHPETTAILFMDELTYYRRP